MHYTNNPRRTIILAQIMWALYVDVSIIYTLSLMYNGALLPDRPTLSTPDGG